MRHVRVGIAAAVALTLPLTASSASAQARVEVEEWWTTEAALDRAPQLFETAPAPDELEIVDDFGYSRDAVLEFDDGSFRENRRTRGEAASQGRVVYVDPRGRIDFGTRGRWDARVEVFRHDRRYAYAYRPNWRRVRWHVRFDINRRTRFYDEHLNRRELRDLLGRRTTDRLKDHARRIDARGRLVGRWVEYGRRGRVLQVRAGGVPVAELIAFGRDRRVDIVRLNVRRWRDDYDRYYNDYRYDRYDGDRYDDYYNDDYRDDDDRRRRRRGRK